MLTNTYKLSHLLLDYCTGYLSFMVPQGHDKIYLVIVLESITLECKRLLFNINTMP